MRRGKIVCEELIDEETFLMINVNFMYIVV